MRMAPSLRMSLSRPYYYLVRRKGLRRQMEAASRQMEAASSTRRCANYSRRSSRAAADLQRSRCQLFQSYRARALSHARWRRAIAGGLTLRAARSPMPSVGRAFSTLVIYLTASAKPARVLFEAWDAEAAGEGGALTGTFNREALRRALPALHIGCTKAEADALFDLLDASGSGAIPYTGGLLGGGDRKSGGKKGKGKGGSKKHPQRLISDSMSAAYFLPRVQRAASAGRERPLLTISPRVVSEDPEVAAARAKLDPKASPTNAAEEAEPAEKKASAADAAVVTLPSPPGRGRNSARKPNPPNHRKLHLDGLIGASPPTQTPRTGKKKTPRSKRTKEATAAASSGVEAQQASTPAAAVIDVGDADEGAAAPPPPPPPRAYQSRRPVQRIRHHPRRLRLTMARGCLEGGGRCLCR